MSELEQELRDQLHYVRQHLDVPSPNVHRALQPPHHRRRSLRLLLAGILGTGAAVGGSFALVGAITGHSSPSPSPTKPAPAPVASTTTTTTTPTSTTTPMTTTITAAISCRSADRSVAVGPQIGAAGTDYFPLVFTNTGIRSCTLQGYPGVSFVDASGNQVASAAVRQETGPGPLINVAPGQSATATAMVLEGAAGDCANGGQDVNPIGVYGFRVYPPDQTDALFAPQSLPICADSPPNTLSIFQFGVPPSSEN
jgi:hypothetical protein